MRAGRCHGHGMGWILGARTVHVPDREAGTYTDCLMRQVEGAVTTRPYMVYGLR